jgi:hypothetical protein
VLRQANQKRLMRNDHFSVDGTLIEAWATLKSLEEGAAAGAARRSRQSHGGLSWGEASSVL